MLPFKYITIATAAFISFMMMAHQSLAQTNPAPDAVYYVCADEGYKITGPTGFDSYSWSVNGANMPGADSDNIQLQALTAAGVGNSYVTKTYHLTVQNSGANEQEELTYVVYILPKMQLSVSGYLPPYCENLSHNITLSAHINGGNGNDALTLPAGVSVEYTWLVEPNNGMAGSWNAAITGPANQATAQVLTPETSTADNNYTLKVAYKYPASVDLNTDVTGDCGDAVTQNVHADPPPQAPTINYQLL